MGLVPEIPTAVFFPFSSFNYTWRSLKKGLSKRCLSGELLEDFVCVRNGRVGLWKGRRLGSWRCQGESQSLGKWLHLFESQSPNP